MSQAVLEAQANFVTQEAMAQEASSERNSLDVYCLFMKSLMVNLLLD